MIACDLSDLYVACNEGESSTDVILAVRRCAELHAWACLARAGPSPAWLPPLGAGHFVGVVVEPLPPAEVFANVVGAMVGQGRDVRLPYFDAQLRAWRLSGTEWGFAERGLTTRDLFDAQVPLEGSSFARILDTAAMTPLYLGSPRLLAETVRCETLHDRGDLLVFERAALRSGRPATDGKRAAFAGTVRLDAAPAGTIVAVVEEARHRHHRFVEEGFADVESAWRAYLASSEPPGLCILLARLVLRASLA
ncbi:MAG: hypothetical protein U1F54_18240 [Burkholderiales bacterium]